MTRLSLAGFAGFLLLASTLAVRGQDKSDWHEIYQDFRNSAPLIDFMNLVGPGAKQSSKAEAEGLRITLPVDRPVHTPVIVTTNFEVPGDFEITATYEWLSVAKPKKGYGCGVNLTVQSDHGERKQFAKVSRVMRHDHKKGSVYMIESWDHDKKKPDDYTARMFETTATTGQLRLVRKGDVVRYLVAEPPTNIFRELFQQKFSTVPMESAHLAVTDSGEAGNLVDVRLVDFKVRMAKENAAAPPAKAAAPPPPKSGDPTPVTPPTTASEEPARGVPRLVWVLIAVLVLAVLSVGTWFALRSRRGPPPATSTPASKPSEAITADAPIAFACAGCNKQLKVKRTSAGKSVKCPHCGRVNTVPV